VSDDWQDGNVQQMPFAPMLASTRPTGPLRNEWVLEPKLHGWRMIVAVDGAVRAWTRNGYEVTDRLPELAPLIDCFGGEVVVLDGVLVHEEASRDTSSVLYARADQRRRVELTFVAFDVLTFGGSVIDKPYYARRALLDALEFDGPAWCTTPQLHGSVLRVLDACARRGIEGIVAKRLESQYRPGARSTDWIELKTADWSIRPVARRANIRPILAGYR